VISWAAVVAHIRVERRIAVAHRVVDTVVVAHKAAVVVVRRVVAVRVVRRVVVVRVARRAAGAVRRAVGAGLDRCT
jgi:hypothetical protein